MKMMCLPPRSTQSKGENGGGVAGGAVVYPPLASKNASPSDLRESEHLSDQGVKGGDGDLERREVARM